MKAPVAIGVLIAVIAAFGYALWSLMSLRFETGDVYPQYSTLRADPLGAKALFESLDRMPGLKVERNFTQLGLAEWPKAAAVMFLNTPRDEFFTAAFTERDRETIFRHVINGGTLVLCVPERPRPFGGELYPDSLATPDEDEAAPDEASDEQITDAAPGRDRDAPMNEPADKANDGEAPPTESPIDEASANDADDDLAENAGEEDATRGSRAIRLAEQSLSTVFAFRSMQHQGGHFERMATAEAGVPKTLPAEIVWDDATRLSLTSDAWRAVYSVEGEPIVAERTYGDGRVVLFSHPYMFSNQGLWQSREPALLSWVIGSSPTVIFDETHLGTLDERGVMTLIREFGLLGMVLGLLGCATIYIWKTTVPFMPPQDAAQRESRIVEGGASGTGFVNLLRQAIPEKDLPQALFDEWAHSVRRGSLTVNSKDANQEAASLVTDETRRDRKQRNLVLLYQRLAERLRVRSSRL